MHDKILVIHSAKSLIPRRIIHPDTADELENIEAYLMPGEAAFITDKAKSITHTSLGLHPRHLVAEHHCVDVATIPSGRCAVVDKMTNTVVNLIVADPEVDVLSDHHLIAHETADIGWKWDGQSLKDPSDT